MDIKEAMAARHSVRAYTDRKIGEEVRDELGKFIADVNEESGLRMQLVTDEESAFDGFMAHYGKFSGVKNYIAMIGPKGPDLDEKVGYYGEKVVLYATTLGLNSCWVAMSYSKGKAKSAGLKIEKGDKLAMVIAIGYGTTQGVSHRSKDAREVSTDFDNAPDWFRRGVASALLAPTAINQQKFTFGFSGNRVTAKHGIGFYTKTDLGIAKYHFEIGAGKDNFDWA